jgi:hypothetical protein
MAALGERIGDLPQRHRAPVGRGTTQLLCKRDQLGAALKLDPPEAIRIRQGSNAVADAPMADSIVLPFAWGNAGGSPMHKIALAAAAIAVAAITARSGVHAQYKGIMGAGTRSCGDWLQYRSNNLAAAYQLSAWIDGYISGFSRSGDRQRAPGTPLERRAELNQPREVDDRTIPSHDFRCGDCHCHLSASEAS